MKVIINTLAILVYGVALQACSGGGSDPANTPKVYTVSVTNIDVVRTVDQQSLVIEGLPAIGAQLTVNE